MHNYKLKYKLSIGIFCISIQIILKFKHLSSLTLCLPFNSTFFPFTSIEKLLLKLILNCTQTLKGRVDARRYFKQSEIVLYRQTPEVVAAAQVHAQSQPQQITGAAG
jgi:hypothetical protein